MPRELVLVRHGEAYNTVPPDGAREVADPSNPPLTPRGEAQAAAAARRVLDVAPQVVVTSPFLRAAQTAAAYLELADATGTADARLSEHFLFEPLAAFSGIDLADYRARFGERVRIDPALATLAPFPSFPETQESVLERTSAALEDWLARDWTRAAFYGHGATVGAVLRLLAPDAAEVAPLHGSITRLVEEERGTWRTHEVNAVDHLPEAPAAPSYGKLPGTAE